MKATYTQAEVLQLFNMCLDTLYKQPKIMACRVSQRPVRYSRAKIDKILGIEPAVTVGPMHETVEHTVKLMLAGVQP